MKLKSVLKRLDELFESWGINNRDWILAAQYSYKLQGYDIKVREGHFNVLMPRSKVPWKIGAALETHPPSETKYGRENAKFVKDTGFEFDISPLGKKEFEREKRTTINYALHKKHTILLQKPIGGINQLDKILENCTPEGWGVEKGVRILSFIEDQIQAFLKKGEQNNAKEYEKLLTKYGHLKKVSGGGGNKENLKVIKGVVASKGVAVGKVNVVLNPDLTKKFEKGEILVTTMTSPKFTPFFNKTAAIVTDEGGILSHAAIVSREMGIPCIVGTKIATKIFKDGDLIEVDAEKGIGIIRKIK